MKSLDPLPPPPTKAPGKHQKQKQPVPESERMAGVFTTLCSYEGTKVPEQKDAIEIVSSYTHNEMAYTVDNNRGRFVTLCAPHVMFVDIDWSDGDPHPQRVAALKVLRRFLDINPEYGCRVYLTAGGLRYLFTSHYFKPTQWGARQIMEQLGADPKYVEMCQRHLVFTARIDPKKERVVPGKKYAACQFLWSAGNPAIREDILDVLKFHDIRTKAFSELPLA